MHLGGLCTRNTDPSGVAWEEEPRWPTPLGFLLRAGLTCGSLFGLVALPSSSCEKGAVTPAGEPPWESKTTCAVFDVFPGQVVRELIIDVATWEMTRKGRRGMFLDPEPSHSLYK